MKIESMDKKSKKIYITATVIAGISFVIGIFLLTNTFLVYISNEKEISKLNKLTNVINDNYNQKEQTEGRFPSLLRINSNTHLQIVKSSNNDILPKYKSLNTLNKDIKGWIKLDDSMIDYPILQYSDNNYYMKRDFKRKMSTQGSIFCDYRNKVNTELMDKNILIYGHNMKDGTMFHDLVKYKDKQFFNKHKYINIDSLYKKGLYEVFSVYILNADYETIEFKFKGEASFVKAANEFKKRSLFKTDIIINSKDRIITLVTCSYESNNVRTIVHAKLVNN